jgi:hypothetical protein
MIRVTVELLPLGYESGKRKLGVMYIANDGVTSRETNGKRGSYDFDIFGKRKLLRSGRVEDYPRKSAIVWVLLHRALNVAFGKKEKA